MKLLDKYKSKYENTQEEVMSLEEYLKRAKKDASYYANSAARLLKAIGEPELINTALNPRLARIFEGRTIKVYKSFADFYGIEDSIERVVSFFKHAEQGLEEVNQILYLLGPPGSAKSTFAERLKSLMEQEPIYVLAHKGQKSPVNDSPLSLFKKTDAAELQIPARYFNKTPSGWLIKRLVELNGDISQLEVIKAYPNRNTQTAIAVVAAADPNNQDISTLVGKLDIRKLEFFSQNDPDAYNYGGGLCRSNQGLLEFIEMFKADINTLNPLLTATQDHLYEPTEKIGMLPFEGVILAHSNENEWNAFKNDKKNEALLDRIYLVEFPYCTRITDEIKIYEKFLNNSSLDLSKCAPKTLQSLAEFCIMTRLDPVDVQTTHGTKKVTDKHKMRMYDGQRVEESSALTLQAYRDQATHEEGFYGVSTRDAFKILGETFNYDVAEVAANPVHLFITLRKMVDRERYDETKTEHYLNIIKNYLEPEFLKEVTKHIQKALVESYDEFGQASFDRYFLFADHYTQDTDYRDVDTGAMYDKEALNKELEKLEKAAGIANPRDFRQEVVGFVLRYKAEHGKTPSWRSYEKLRKVIEANMFSKTADLLPVISFSGHKSKEEKEKHDSFIKRMEGYTEKQVRIVVEWFMRQQKQ